VGVPRVPAPPNEAGRQSHFPRRKAACNCKPAVERFGSDSLSFFLKKRIKTVFCLKINKLKIINRKNDLKHALLKRKVTPK
jgi:hypothetical protein